MFVRSFQRIVARIGIATLLFTQLAVAAYACPQPAGAGASPLTHEQTAGMPAGCEMLDSANLHLCRQHCEVGNQSLTGDACVSLPAAMPMTVLLTIVEPLQAAPAPELTNLPVLRERETGPRPLIRFHFFRI